MNQSEKLVQIFQNSSFGDVRVIKIQDVPYFVANDVAKALGYKNPSDATNTHCKKSVMTWGSDSLGRRQEFKVIPEGDIYRLVVKSQLPGAEEFESWIFDEVIPSLRKNGIYATDVTIDNMIANPDFAIELLSNLKKEREEKELLKSSNEIKDLQIQKQNKVIISQAPIVEYANTVLNSTSLIAMTVVAKDFGYKSASELTKDLQAKGILCKNKVNGVYVLTKKYAGNGYTKTKDHPYTDSLGNTQTSRLMYWTEKGVKFLHDFLIKNLA